MAQPTEKTEDKANEKKSLRKEKKKKWMSGKHALRSSFYDYFFFSLTKSVTKNYGQLKTHEILVEKEKIVCFQVNYWRNHAIK